MKAEISQAVQRETPRRCTFFFYRLILVEWRVLVGGAQRRSRIKTVGKNARIIEEYIKNQLEEDYMAEQISIKEYIDPFTGNKNK